MTKHLPVSASPGRVFAAGLACVLALVGLYTAIVLVAWAHSPLGLRPQGEAAAWLAGGESLFRGNVPSEPLFRASAYLAVLAGLQSAGVSSASLADAARAVNGVAHVLATALVAWLAWRLWKRSASAWLAGALWGFYPPAVFMAAEPGPHSLALLWWLLAACAAFETIEIAHVPHARHVSRHRIMVFSALAGGGFVIAAVFYAPLWPAALAWLVVVLFFGGVGRARRLASAALGVGAMTFCLVVAQEICGGSPQPLAGADLYRLAMGLEITQPWAAPLPPVPEPGEVTMPDALEQESLAAYHAAMGQGTPGRAVLDGYWWRQAVGNAASHPVHSLLRAARKVYQFFYYANHWAGPDYARAQSDSLLLGLNPLCWPLLLAAAAVGLLLGGRAPGERFAVLLAVLAAAGMVLWYPTMDARAPVAVVLAVLAGRLAERPWTRTGMRVALPVLALGTIIFTFLPRPGDPASELAARDARNRAMAWSDLGNYDEALAELTRAAQATPLSLEGRNLAAEWRFARVVTGLPKLPAQNILQEQLFDNAELVKQSNAAQFRCGACLWLLGQHDGALFYWRALADDSAEWGATAREALAYSGQETPAEALRRSAWKMGGGPKPNSTLLPFFKYMYASR